MSSQSPDTKITFTSPVRAPSAAPVDAPVIPVAVNALDLRGRMARLAPALDGVRHIHHPPAPVVQHPANGLVLTILLFSTLKFERRFILHAQCAGVVPSLIVASQAPDRLRAYARYDRTR